MGYESTLIVAQVNPPIGNFADGAECMHVLAAIDLSKMGADFGEFVHQQAESFRPRRESTDPLIGWWPLLAFGEASDAAWSTEDPYGEPPKRLDFADTVKWLEANDDGYRRIAPALALLRVYAEQDADGTWADAEDLRLYHIGH